jgi:hypothetical protein
LDLLARKVRQALKAKLALLVRMVLTAKTGCQANRVT